MHYYTSIILQFLLTCLFKGSLFNFILFAFACTYSGRASHINRRALYHSKTICVLFCKWTIYTFVYNEFKCTEKCNSIIKYRLSTISMQMHFLKLNTHNYHYYFLCNIVILHVIILFFITLHKQILLKIVSWQKQAV